MNAPDPELRLSRDVLAAWPGRFRHAELMVALHARAGGDELADGLLAGLAAGRKEEAVAGALLDDGEFDLVELMIAEAPAIGARVRAQLVEDLESGRAARSGELTSTLASLYEQAAAASLRIDVDVAELEGSARRSWPSVARLLAREERALAERIAERSAALHAQVQASSLDPREREMVESLIKGGRLTVAEQALDDSEPLLSIPEMHPPLPVWPWKEPAETVLSWHVDPSRSRPPEFSGRRAEEPATRRLLQATAGLADGGQAAAREFAASLDVFLHGGEEQVPVVHSIDGGHLTTVSLFVTQPLARFHGTTTVELFIAGPHSRSVSELPGVDHFLAVGPDLEPATGFRGAAALLSTRDIIRLAGMANGRRAVALARIAGPQWPLAALGSGTAAALRDLLSGDDTERWQTLCWLVDLTGLGSSRTAESLLYHAGGDPPSTYALLGHLLDSAGAADQHLNEWPMLKRPPAAIESAVLRGCDSTAALAAFWAAMASAPPGTALTLDALVLTAVLSVDEVDWEPAITAGFAQLRRQWFVEPGGEDTVTLRPLGVIMSLRRLTERRLADLARELADEDAREPESDLWAAYRHALSPDWPERVRVAVGGGVPAPAAVLDADVLVAAAARGATDLTEVVAELVGAAGARFPNARIEHEIQAGVQVAVERRTLLTIVYELLENALEATGRAGMIAVSARATQDEVVLDIRDSGPGIAAEIVRLGSVFRPGISTRGERRGAGLNIARRVAAEVDGDLEVTSRRDGHPIYAGAHMSVAFPRAVSRS